MSKQTPISIAVKSIKCVRATGDSGTDEPYVIVAAADVTPIVDPLTHQTATPPRLSVTITGEWHGVNDGDARGTIPLPPVPDGVSENIFPASEDFVWRKHCWGLDNGKAAAIPDRDNVILLVVVGEQDDSEIGQVRSL